MESFGDTRSFSRVPVNIHEVLDRVRRVAETSFARNVNFHEEFDPSLPRVLGDRDQLIQVFMNLVRNAADALPESGGEIALTNRLSPRRALRRGVAGERLSLPLQVTVRDNGAGVPADSDALHLRPLRDDEAWRLRFRIGAGRQDRRRPRRRHRVRFRAAPHRIPYPVAESGKRQRRKLRCLTARS